jgi:hypothetical protein
MKRPLPLTIILLICATMACAQKDSETRRAHAERSFTIHLQATPAEVFPLFGPLAEREWSPQWLPHFISPPDGARIARGAVFSTTDEHGEQTWVLTAYDPQEGHLSYCIFWPGFVVSELEIRVLKSGGETSSAEVLYRHTALSAEGDSLVARMAEHHGAMSPHWEHAINEALRKRRENVSH